MKLEHKIKLLLPVGLIANGLLIGFDLITVNQCVSTLICIVSIYLGMSFQKTFYKEEYNLLKAKELYIEERKEEIAKEVGEAVLESIKNKSYQKK